MNNVIIVHEKPNPSTDYYLLPHVRTWGTVTCCDWKMPKPAEPAPGTSVVFVRYIPWDWVFWVQRHRKNLRHVVYFMDDDLLDWFASAVVPWRFRLKIIRLATWRKGWLKGLGAKLWVSTPFLAAKYARWSPELLRPMPLTTAPVKGGPQPTTIFYHGSTSHRLEKEWLLPIMERVLAQAPEARFEIIGATYANQLYCKLPRVEVIHPLSWENYLAFCTNKERHIGLAPLLDHGFNAGRSYSKFFDIQRSGAAGIYSNVPVFSEFVRHGVDGLLVDNDPELWVKAILGLLADAEKRARIVHAAGERVAALQGKR